MDEQNKAGPSPPDDALSIAGWRVHVDSNRITRGEHTVKLEPRAMALLCFLAQRPGEVLTRERLEAEVWAGMVIGYDALSNSITKLRKAFDDDRKNPRIIETIPKVGYRLIAAVEQGNVPDEASKDDQRPARKTRKLAAILYADVAEYSRLTEADEEGTHDILSLHLDAITRAIEHHNGKVVHYAGDAMLAEFTTVVEALGCAVGVQRELAVRNAGQSADATVQFRMGINLGDVIVDRDDIYGEGVNVAARLESLADPGGVCISESVRGAIGKKLPLGYEFLGEQSVKNIVEPVRAYRVMMAPDAKPVKSHKPVPLKMLAGAAAAVLLIVIGAVVWHLNRTGPVGPQPTKPTIAVLPLTNMSDDLALEHVADGMTDDLITDLSKISGLFVIARHSAFTFKDRSAPIDEIADKLGVRHVLVGSLRKTAEQLRINVQLIDAETEGQLWAERYTTEATALFEIQDRVIENIVAALEVELTEVEKQQIARIPTPDLEAYDYYQRAERRRLDPDAKFVDMLRLYQRALELDPKFSAALAGLARLAFDIWQLDGAEALPPTTARKLAYESASEVLSLEPDNADAFGVLALLQATQGEHALAETSAKKAVALTPNKARGHLDLGIVLSVSGKHSEALLEMEAVSKIDPEPTLEFHGELGRILFFDAQYQRAIGHLEKTRGLGPRFDNALAGSYAELGRIEEAKAVLTGDARWQQIGNLAWYRTLWSHYQPKDLDHILRSLAKAGLPEWPYGYWPAVERQLAKAELESLTAGTTWAGTSLGGGDFVRQFTTDGRVALRMRATLLTGTAQIQADQLCIRIPSALLARDDCGRIYRHAGGSSQEQNEYVHVTIGDVYFFSVAPP